jgi:hypothetical protein
VSSFFAFFLFSLTQQLKGVPDNECNLGSLRPKTSLVYVKTHKTGSSTLTNILHRFTIKHRLRPVLPKNNIFLGYPSPSMLPNAFVPLAGKVGGEWP